MSYNIGIIGASGLVGNELINLFKLFSNEKSDDKIKKIEANDINFLLFTSSRSVKGFIEYNYKKIPYILLNEENIIKNSLDVVFMCATTEVSRLYVRIIRKCHPTCYIIDNSSAFRMDPSTPLIIPEINADILKKENYLIANPNCTSAIISMPMYPIFKSFGLNRMIINTYQAVSGSGKKAINQLIREMNKYSKELKEENKTIFLGNKHEDKEDKEDRAFLSDIFMNLFPHDSPIDKDTKCNEEELKMMNEIPKIFQSGDSLKIAANCVRVPTIRSHSISVYFETEKETSEKELERVINFFPGTKVESISSVEPKKCSGNLEVYVSRIREDISFSDKKHFQIWICGDQLLRGAAYNAFLIYNAIKKL